MTEQELNKLNVKSDSLPDNWLVTLVNPATGAVAENMTVARFIELFTSKLPVATENSNGLMSAHAYSLSFKLGSLPESGTNTVGDISDAPTGYGWFNNTSSPSFKNAPGGMYGMFVRFFHPLIHVTFYITSHGPIYYKKSNDDCVQIYPSTNLKTSRNQLTDTISNSCSFTPPLQIACQTIQNKPVRSSNLRIRQYWISTSQMVQLQLELNHRNSTSGLLIRLAELSWNYRKKIRDLNKSSLTMASRYRSNNLPRAGPPRLIY